MILTDIMSEILMKKIINSIYSPIAYYWGKVYLCWIHYLLLEILALVILECFFSPNSLSICLLLTFLLLPLLLVTNVSMKVIFPISRSFQLKEGKQLAHNSNEIHRSYFLTREFSFYCSSMRCCDYFDC